MESDYTPMGGKAKIETFVESNPDFKSTIRYEDSEKREGFLVLTDGSFSFGYVNEDEFRQLLERRIEEEELSNRPAIFDFINCDAIERNTKRYIHEESQSNLSKYAKAVDDKVSKFIPNKTKAVVTTIIIVGLCIAVPIMSSKIFSNNQKGYDEEFYTSGMVEKRLNNFKEKWERFEETEKTKNPKLAEYTAREITEFRAAVNIERLTEEERETLDALFEKAKSYVKE